MESRFPIVDTLKRDIEVHRQLDGVAALVADMRSAIDGDTDPYVLAGVLLEGIVATVAHGIPSKDQGEVAVNIVRLLRDRFHGNGII